MQKNRLSATKAKGYVVHFFPQKRTALVHTIEKLQQLFSGVPILMAADKPCPQLQPSLITCASSSGFRDCLHTITTLCQISFGLKRLMRRACLVRRASLRTLGNMFQTMALTRRSSSSQMNRKMSLKVESSENVKWRDVI